MSPRDKAKDLFDRYFLKMENGIDENGAWICIALNKGMAKGCALIAIDEIIKVSMDNLYSEKYWQEVKQQILAL